MAIGDVYRLTLRSLFAGQQLQNTFHLQRKTAPDPTLAQAQSLADDWKDAIRQNQNAGVTYTTWELRQVRGLSVIYDTNLCERSGGILLDGSLTGTLTGTVAGDGLPPQAAIVATLLTGISGRRRRGRIYYGGISESDQNAGTVASGALSNIGSQLASQLVQYGVSGTDPDWQWVVWSDVTAFGCKVNPNPPPSRLRESVPNPGSASAPITQIKVRNVVYSQRRRTVGVGI